MITKPALVIYNFRYDMPSIELRLKIAHCTRRAASTHLAIVKQSITYQWL